MQEQPRFLDCLRFSHFSSLVIDLLSLLRADRMQDTLPGIQASYIAGVKVIYSIMLEAYSWTTPLKLQQHCNSI